MKKSQKKQLSIELVIESIGFKGISVARNDGLVYFLKGGVPGDKVIAETRKRRKKHIEAEILEILEPSKARIDPICKYFGVCGGCSWQNISYDEQLLWKKQHVIDAFQRIGNFKYVNVLDSIPSAKLYNYRNKMDFSFGASRWLTKEEIQDNDVISNKNFALGLHIPGRYDKVLDIDTCHIQEELGNEILNLFREKAIELNVSAYSDETRDGFLKNLVLRYSLTHREMMSIFISNTPKTIEDESFLNWYRYDFQRQYPEFVSVIHAINSKTNPVSYGKINFIEGKAYIIEDILGIKYRISPFSFFQTNSYQLDSFIGKILDYSNLKKDEIVWDLYCGTGSISLPASKLCKEVYGFELIESSIEDAKLNAELNGIYNIKFRSMDLHSKASLNELLDYEKPDVLIIDPPRNGMNDSLVYFILDIAPRRIVYVSCNPTTQARDCEILTKKYEIEKIQPVDMFPHTYHIESIALLNLKDNNV